MNELELIKLRNRMYVGVAGFICRQAPTGMYYLVHQRQGSHGSGTWALCGGHIDAGENPDNAIMREIEEEFGYQFDDFVKFEEKESIDIYQFPVQTINHFPPEGDRLHILSYLTYFYGLKLSGKGRIEPLIREPNKCSAIKWIRFEDFFNTQQLSLFAPLQTFFELSKRSNWPKELL